MPKVKRDFDNLTEFIGFALGKSDMTTGRSSRRSESGSGSYSFFGSPNMSAAESMAFNWPEGAERVSKLKALVSLGNIRKEKTIVPLRKAPGRLDMGRVMQGHPYAYQRVVDTDNNVIGASRNVVDIVINACVSAGVSTDTIEARGAAMLALTEALEQRGKHVRITVGMANRSGIGMEYKIVVKQPSQALNLNSVAFAVAHPSFFRRFIFSAMETENATVRRSLNVGSGYGQVGEFAMEDLPKNAIYMGGADFYKSQSWNDVDYIKSWIIDEMAKQGVVIDAA